MYLFHCKGQSLRYLPGWGNQLHCLVALHVGEGIREGTMLLAWLSAGFHSVFPLPTSKLGPSGAESRVSGPVYILGVCVSLQWTLLWGWEFLPLLQPPQVFIARGFEAFFSYAGNLGCTVCLAPQLFLPIYPHRNVELPATALPAWSSSHHLASLALAASLHPSYQPK